MSCLFLLLSLLVLLVVAVASAELIRIICTLFQTDNHSSSASLNFLQAKRCLRHPADCIWSTECRSYGYVSMELHNMLHLVSGTSFLLYCVNLIPVSPALDSYLPASTTPTSSVDSPILWSITPSLFHSQLKTRPFHKSTLWTPLVPKVVFRFFC